MILSRIVIYATSALISGTFVWQIVEYLLKK